MDETLVMIERVYNEFNAGRKSSYEALRDIKLLLDVANSELVDDDTEREEFFGTLDVPDHADWY